MDTFWDLVNAARQKPALAAFAALVVFCLLGALVLLVRTVV
jgi:hypothetical protein